MDTIKFVLGNYDKIAQLGVQHLSIVLVAVGLAILTGVPIGITITQNRAVADAVLYIASIIVTIPSIAPFGSMIPVLSLIGSGIGWLPAVIAILLYSQRHGHDGAAAIYNRLRLARRLLPAVRDSNIGLVHRETGRLIDRLGIPDFVRGDT
jgi:osmoprotectant transport system permease protein